MIFTDNGTNIYWLYESFFDELSFINYNGTSTSHISNLQESFGIAELENKTYQDSLEQISKQVLDIVSRMRRGDYHGLSQCEVYNRVANTNEDDVDERFYGALLTADVNGVDWIDHVNIIIQCPAPIHFQSQQEYIRSVPYEHDSVLLGDSEKLLDIENHVYKPTEVVYYAKSFGPTKCVHIPLKIKDGRITECYVVIMVGRKSLSASDVQTMIDHEVGHAKDVLDRHTSYKDMNADIIDLNTMRVLGQHQLPSSININIRKMVECLTDSTLSSDKKREKLRSIVDEYVIVMWFCDIHYYLNLSEIVQHRKNFFTEIRKALATVKYNSPMNDYMRKNSEEYRTYDDISKVLHGLIEYTPDAIKQRVVDEFIKCFISVDRGNGRKQYIYGRQFMGRNRNYGVNSFDEFMRYHANNVDKYFLYRCKKLFMVYRSVTEGCRAPFSTLGGMSIDNYAKRIVEQAEEELLID